MKFCGKIDNKIPLNVFNLFFFFNVGVLGAFFTLNLLVVTFFYATLLLNWFLGFVECVKVVEQNDKKKDCLMFCGVVF